MTNEELKQIIQRIQNGGATQQDLERVRVEVKELRVEKFNGDKAANPELKPCEVIIGGDNRDTVRQMLDEQTGAVLSEEIISAAR